MGLCFMSMFPDMFDNGSLFRDGLGRKPLGGSQISGKRAISRTVEPLKLLFRCSRKEQPTLTVIMSTLRSGAGDGSASSISFKQQTKGQALQPVLLFYLVINFLKRSHMIFPILSIPAAMMLVSYISTKSFIAFLIKSLEPKGIAITSIPIALAFLTAVFTS